jgi:hypothetical protein
MIGRPVSIFARNDDTSKFSCASLVNYAYARSGIALHNLHFSRVVPDDLISSPHIEVVRVVFTENTRVEREQKEVTNDSCQRASG